jgi:hypothetical protein
VCCASARYIMKRKAIKRLILNILFCFLSKINIKNPKNRKLYLNGVKN